MRQEWFENAQDRALIQNAFDAFGDKFLWTFIEVTTREMWVPTEGDRRWGMVCNCPQHIEDRKKGVRQIWCDKNSRRLAEAWDYMQRRIAENRERARTLSLEDCEGNHEVQRYCSTMLLKLSGFENTRFKYLGVPPWTAVKCRTPEGAREFSAQVRAAEWSTHDPYSRWFMDTLGIHVAARANEEDLHPDLEEELERLETTPLDEAAGEGYHRDVTCELHRASASSQAHLKRTTRKKGVFRRLRVWKNASAMKAGRSCVSSTRTINGSSRRTAKQNGRT